MPRMIRCRRNTSGVAAALGLLALALGGILEPGGSAWAGGPLVVGGTFGPPGQPFTWDISLGEVQYRTDGGGLGVLSNSEANDLVAAMFQVWEDVPTAAIGFNRLGQITGLADGNVETLAEFDRVVGRCEAGSQSPIIYDKQGALFSVLFGPGSGVIGFAGPCQVSSGGRIVSALVALNGGFLDGQTFNGELTGNEFEAVFIHEFGHFFGLDHSQVNLNCLFGCASGSDDAFGLPTMFPFLISGLTEVPGVHPARTLSMDDLAWVSRLYPDPSFSSSYGTISGTILFSDGLTPAQGVNVIARRVNDLGTTENESRRFAVSVVSGYRFTGNPGQSVTGTNTGGSPFGSRDPALIGAFEIPVPPGAYTIEVEGLSAAFQGGSSVGPLDPPFPNPGAQEFWNVGEANDDPTYLSSPVTVAAGATASGIDIILNGTPRRLDAFEIVRLWLRESLAPWLRENREWVRG